MGEQNEIDRIKIDSIKNFDIDDIKDIIENYQNTHNKLDFVIDLDLDGDISEKEKGVIDKIKSAGDIIEGLNNLIKRISTYKEQLYLAANKKLKKQVDYSKKNNIYIPTDLIDRIDLLKYTDNDEIYNELSDIIGDYNFYIKENIRQELSSDFKEIEGINNKADFQKLLLNKDKNTVYKLLNIINGDSKILKSIKGLEEYNKRMLDVYLDALYKNNDYKEIESILQNDNELLEFHQICPSAEKTIEIREGMIKAQNDILTKNVTSAYGKELGATFILNLNESLASLKGKEHCTIKIIDFIKTFEETPEVKKYLKDNGLDGYKDKPKKVKELMFSILETSKIENNLENMDLYNQLGLSESEGILMTENELYKLAENKGVDKAVIDSIIKNRNLNKNTTLRQDFIEKLTKEEFTYIWNNIDKNPEDIRKEIEKQREEKEKQSSLNQLENIDNRPFSQEKGSLYSVAEISGDEQSGKTIKLENGTILTGVSIGEYNKTIEKDENGNDYIKDPEAFKNLVDFKEKMDLLHLDFVWEYRNELIDSIKNTEGFKSVEMNLEDDLINKTEVNNILKFVLTLVGEIPSSNESTNNSKIYDLNGGGELNNKTNTHSGYSNIGQKFLELGYIGVNSFDKTNNKSNIIGYRNILNKQQNENKTST